MRQIRAKLWKNSSAEKSGSLLAASRAAAIPPKSATFSDTVSFPLIVAP